MFHLHDTATCRRQAVRVVRRSAARATTVETSTYEVGVAEGGHWEAEEVGSGETLGYIRVSMHGGRVGASRNAVFDGKRLDDSER